MIHKSAIQILASKILLRDVVWLGIASKLSLLSPYTTLLCYFVTSSFFATTQKGGKDCKSAENQSYIEPDPKTIREKWHMMTMTITMTITITITITIGMRPLFPPILHSILQIAM